MVIAKDETKASEDYKIEYLHEKDLTIRAIRTNIGAEFTEFSFSHHKCDLVVDYKI